MSRMILSLNQYEVNCRLVLKYKSDDLVKVGILVIGLIEDKQSFQGT
jgi:hypothetical protein